MCVAVGHPGIRLTCGWFDVVEISATDRFNEFAVDKVLDLEWLGAHGEAKRKPSSSTSNVQRGKIVLGRDMMLILRLSRGKESYEKIVSVARWLRSVCSDLRIRGESWIQRRVRSIVSL